MEYKYKKILRQCSILVVNFWSVTYFGVFNFDTSYLGAKIGQNKTMTKISRFTVMLVISVNDFLKLTGQSYAFTIEIN